jgi:hypothetical protein
VIERVQLARLPAQSPLQPPKLRLRLLDAWSVTAVP